MVTGDVSYSSWSTRRPEDEGHGSPLALPRRAVGLFAPSGFSGPDTERIELSAPRSEVSGDVLRPRAPPPQK